ncbi:hypothetical protein [Acrocarpospora catenulata]|uniref:hypothetical protein n=1 Tax=Acrocarpospora catenulata TaxID=2836182 RepID=UPI001BD9ED97|nr:hypothetical protein [Acrocarpospora catenulata]
MTSLCAAYTVREPTLLDIVVGNVNLLGPAFLPVIVGVLVVLDALGVRGTGLAAPVVAGLGVLFAAGQWFTLPLGNPCVDEPTIMLSPWLAIVAYALAAGALVLARTQPLRIDNPGRGQLISWGLALAAATWWTLSFFVPLYPDPSWQEMVFLSWSDEVVGAHYMGTRDYADLPTLFSQAVIHVYDATSLYGLHLGPLTIVAVLAFLVSHRATLVAIIGLYALGVLLPAIAWLDPDLCALVPTSPFVYVQIPLVIAATILLLARYPITVHRTLIPRGPTRDLIIFIGVTATLAAIVLMYFLP